MRSTINRVELFNYNTKKTFVLYITKLFCSSSPLDVYLIYEINFACVVTKFAGNNGQILINIFFPFFFSKLLLIIFIDIFI
jgi:hypothetical protein